MSGKSNWRRPTKKQQEYVAARAAGKTREQSAIVAGYSENENTVASIEKSPTVQEELAKVRAETAEAVNITKEDVVRGLKAAADLAATMADPQSMVRAWAEIGKMLGHYAPETKKHIHELKNPTEESVKGLPDAQLHLLAHGRVIEGEFERVTE